MRSWPKVDRIGCDEYDAVEAGGRELGDALADDHGAASRDRKACLRAMGSRASRDDGDSRGGGVRIIAGPDTRRAGQRVDRKSVVYGKSVSVRVDIGGRRIIKKKNKNHKQMRK